MNNNPALAGSSRCSEGRKKKPPPAVVEARRAAHGGRLRRPRRPELRRRPPPRRASARLSPSSAIATSSAAAAERAAAAAAAAARGRLAGFERSQEEGTAPAGRDARARAVRRPSTSPRTTSRSIATLDDAPNGRGAARARACAWAHVSGRPVPAGRVVERSHQGRRTTRRRAAGDPRRRREERRAALQGPGAVAPARVGRAGRDGVFRTRRLRGRRRRRRRWCSRRVRAALRAAERASDDESSVPPRRTVARGARRRLVPVGPVFPQHDAARHDQAPRAAARKKKSVAPPPCAVRRRNGGVLQDRAVMMASWWRFGGVGGVPRERRGAIAEKGNSQRLLVKAYDADARRRRVRVGPRARRP